MDNVNFDARAQKNILDQYITFQNPVLIRISGLVEA